MTSQLLFDLNLRIIRSTLNIVVTNRAGKVAKLMGVGTEKVIDHQLVDLR